MSRGSQPDPYPSAEALNKPNVSPSATTEAKPFPFLRLPAELRNRVYDYAVGDLPTPFMLEHTSPGTRASQGALAFTTVCKQVHAEFQPLFMNSVKIHLRDLCAFLQAFFPDTDEELYKPSDVTVVVSSADVDKEYEFEPRLLSRAQARNPDLEWHVERDYIHATSEENALLNWMANKLALVLDHTIELPQCFHRDVERGYISAMTFQYTAYRIQWWTLKVRKEVGGLADLDLEKLREYFKILHEEDFLKTLNGFAVVIEDSEGNFVEEHLIC